MNSHKTFVGQREEKKQLARPKRKWENNITMDIGERGWEGVDWIHLALETIQLRDLVNINEPSSFILPLQS